MELVEAINTRYAVRAFLNRPVSREVLERIIFLARQAPSWANTQPWEFVVVAGEALERIRARYLEEESKGAPFRTDLSFPAEWPEPMQNRISENSRRMYQAMGVEPTEESRRTFRRQALQFFGAPAVVFMCLDKSLSVWSMFDLGSAAQTLMLAARGFGLHTCPAVTFAAYPDILRQEMPIPDNLQVVMGIALGTADPRAPVNSHKSTRVSIGEQVYWHGV